MNYSLKTKYIFGNGARLWIVFIIAGVFAWLSPYIYPQQENDPLKVILVGAFGVVLGLALRLCTKGLQIDLQQKRIREYASYFGIKSGEWKSLPTFDRVVLTSRKVSHWNTPNGVSPTFKSDVNIYTIGLFSGDANPEYIIQSESQKLAEREAEQISNLLSVPLKSE